jgi:hypothetical protein
MADTEPGLNKFVMWLGMTGALVGLTLLVGAVAVVTWGNDIYISVHPDPLAKALFAMSTTTGGIGGLPLSGPGALALAAGAALFALGAGMGLRK